MDRSYYLNLRNKYLPSKLKTIFILESPPVSGKYFYDEDGSIGEPLFKALMKLLQVHPATKKAGLSMFRDTGHFLVDATYTPINELKGRLRDSTILADYENLIKDLKSLCSQPTPDIILIKANICRLLEPKLRSDGFKVKNNGVIIPFPSSGQQANFEREIQKLY